MAQSTAPPSGPPRHEAAGKVNVTMPDRDILLRELNHRIKNNFQIIVSLISLKKRMMPPDRREDMRFIEEHVQSMSVAYRQVYATGGITDVSLTDLIADVVSGLRQIANLNEDQLQVDIDRIDLTIGLDKAIALALYLAVILPPHLDKAAASAGQAMVSARMSDGQFNVMVSGTWPGLIELDHLRQQLAHAYAAQLGSALAPAPQDTGWQIRFPPQPPAAAPDGA